MKGGAWILAAATCLVGLQAQAVELELSGYATLGYAVSDQPYRYQRFIDDNGTLRRDSVVGLQLDAKFTPHWGATVQVKAAPDTKDDGRYEASVAWAFVSYRPSNDWLFRFGRQRVPLYLHSASFDVGMTYDFARLPTEMYSIAQNNDFDSVSVARTWNLASGDLTLDLLWGRSKESFRYWSPTALPGVLPRGAGYRRFDVDGGGFALAYRRDEDTFRLAYGTVRLRQIGRVPIPVTYPFVSLAPGIGYYQIDPSLPGPGIPTVPSFRFNTLSLGADVELGEGWRVMGEWARSRVPATRLSTDSERGYVALSRRVGQWTPYVSFAYLRSSTELRKLHEGLSTYQVPPLVPGAAQITAGQRAVADTLPVYDQRAIAVGTSYLLSPTQKIKAELMQVRIGQTSALVDLEPGVDLRRQRIHVLSLSYNMVF